MLQRVSTPLPLLHRDPYVTMPSFYPRPAPHGLPLTPPDFVPGYNGSGCAAMPYQHSSYCAQRDIGVNRISQDEGRYDFVDRYGQGPIQAVPTSTSYQQPASFPNPVSSNMSVSRYYEPLGAPVLPSMRTYDPAAFEATAMQQRHQQEHQARLEQDLQERKEEKPVGGVSAKLDYDMEWMTDFVSEMAQGMYDLLKSPICIADIDLLRSVQPRQPTSAPFRKWVHGVLCATRLPSATILLGLHYLSIRMIMLSSAGRYRTAEDEIYKLLTTALILGSKFLDDNTFINRSWSEVSGIKVSVLNELEMNWLLAIEFNLHRDPSENQGFCAWLAHWKEYEAHKAARSVRSLKLSPIDTDIRRQRSVHKIFAPPTHQQAYNKPMVQDYSIKHQPSHYSATPAYSQYDPWFVSRSAIENSPASAPHTGPTTPEYYGGSNIWGPSEGYSRRSMFGFQSVPHGLPLPQPQAPLGSQPSSFGHSAFVPQYNGYMMSGHGIGCNCMYCARQHPAYFIPHGLPVAG